VGLIEVMKHRQWDEELLSHELCEEVLLHEPAVESKPEGGSSTPLLRRVRLNARINVSINQPSN
jgi:hypothetical protein